MALNGVEVKVKRDECVLKDRLDLFNAYGSSLLLSDDLAERICEYMKIKKEREIYGKVTVKTVNLSPVELKIIERLNVKKRAE